MSFTLTNVIGLGAGEIHGIIELVYRSLDLDQLLNIYIRQGE